ncbi:MAG: TonB family protein [Acidobacteria bacterium]|nr:TonB family protein [Acidobacteriota bacterium]
MEEIANPVPTLLAELSDERAFARRRETFLLSVIIHLLVILLLVTNPELFRPQPISPKPEPREVTMLYEPPPEQPKLKAPPVPKPPEAPKIEPRLEEPSRELLSRLFEPPPDLPIAPKSAEKPPAPARSEGEGKEQMARQIPPIGIPDFPESPKEPPERRPTLEPVPRAEEEPPSQAQLTLPALAAPSRGTEDILRGMAKEHAAGGSGLGKDFPGFDPSQPGLNIPGPQILSDTMGVDFQPYLLRIYLLVRRNWYSVIPEIARLGKQGRVVLQFSIFRDGTVPDLTLMAGSGTTSLDSAALASIRLSNPFPALPPEFPGDHILLRFVYLYNLPVNYQ